MKIVSRLMIGAGIVLFGVTAVMRRIVQPQDIENLLGHRAAIMVPMLLGAVLIFFGIWLYRRGPSAIQ